MTKTVYDRSKIILVDDYIKFIIQKNIDNNRLIMVDYSYTNKERAYDEMIEHICFKGDYMAEYATKGDDRDFHRDFSIDNDNAYYIKLDTYSQIYTEFLIINSYPKNNSIYKSNFDEVKQEIINYISKIIFNIYPDNK